MVPSKTWLDDARRLVSLEDRFGFLPIKPNSKAPLVQWRNHSGLTIEQCLSNWNCAAISVLTGLDLLCLDFDGLSSLDYAAEQNINFTVNSWHVRRDDEFSRFKVLFEPTAEQIEQLPNGEFVAKHQTKEAIDGQKGEALECFLDRGRYAIVIGKHEDGGNYYWPERLGPEDLAAPPKEIWDWVLEMAHKKQPRKITKSSCRSNWRRLSSCPICGRTERNVCSEHRDGNTIKCFQGSTFSPPTNLQKGELIDGVWAFASEQHVDGIGTFSVFVRHRPSTLQEINKQLAEVHHVF